MKDCTQIVFLKNAILKVNCLILHDLLIVLLKIANYQISILVQIVFIIVNLLEN